MNLKQEKIAVLLGGTSAERVLIMTKRDFLMLFQNRKLRQ